MSSLDIRENRTVTNYSKLEILYRILWGIGKLFFRFSPRILFKWRVIVLRCFGAKIGKNVNIYNTAKIYFPWNLEVGDWACIGEDVFIYNLGKISIGNRSTVSHRAHLCAGTHDYQDISLPLIKQGIVVKDQVWICADAFISPGVNIGTGAIVGARSMVNKDVNDWDIVLGNPAIFIKKRILKSK